MVNFHGRKIIYANYRISKKYRWRIVSMAKVPVSEYELWCEMVRSLYIYVMNIPTLLKTLCNPKSYNYFWLIYFINETYLCFPQENMKPLKPIKPFKIGFIVVIVVEIIVSKITWQDISSLSVNFRRNLPVLCAINPIHGNKNSCNICLACIL